MGRLFFRSIMILVVLFGLLFAVGTGILYYCECPLWWAVAFATLIVGLQYVLAPYIIDRIYNVRWTRPSEISPEFETFLTDLCKKRRIPVPMFGIIEDGNPNAFTYGHVPRDARLVVTRGVHQMLSEEEFNAVVAHEIGHIRHYDFIVMMIASLVPILLYILHRWTYRSGRNVLVAIVVGMGAYVAYFMSQLIVMLLSRVREYYADEHSAYSVKSANSIATALIKISYGLAQISQDDLDDNAKRRSQLLKPSSLMGPLGICAFNSAAPMALYSTNNTGHFSIDKMMSAMQWDLWNPWARLFELQNTHPLVAHRVQTAAKIAMNRGELSLFDYSKPPKESYWPEFVMDAIFAALPYLGMLVICSGSMVLALNMVHQVQIYAYDIKSKIVIDYSSFLFTAGVGLIMYYIGWMFRLAYSYGGSFKEAKIEDLMGEIAVSHVRCIPVEIHGRIIGRGIPGLFWAKDLVVQDDTGFITLVYRQPLKIFNLLFGIFKASELVDREGVFRGWYRRGPTPYLELSEARLLDRSETRFSVQRRVKCYYYKFAWAGCIYGVIFGLAVCWARTLL